MDQSNDVECTLATIVLHNVANHGCDYDDIENRTEIRFKSQRHTILVFRFVVERIIKELLAVM